MHFLLLPVLVLMRGFSKALFHQTPKKSNVSVFARKTAGTGGRILSCHRPVPAGEHLCQPDQSSFRRWPGVTRDLARPFALSRDEKRPVYIIASSAKSWHDENKTVLYCRSPTHPFWNCHILNCLILHYCILRLIICHSNINISIQNIVNSPHE